MIPSSSRPDFVRNLLYDPSILGHVHGMAHSFIELLRFLHNDKVVIHENLSHNLEKFRPVNKFVTISCSNYQMLCHLLLIRVDTAPWKISYDQPRQLIRKQRHYFANKGESNQIYDFSSSHVWMWELNYKESWVPKNRCFWMWCWIRLLRVAWTARRSNPSILKEIGPECSLEGLMLTLKLQYLG